MSIIRVIFKVFTTIILVVWAAMVPLFLFFVDVCLCETLCPIIPSMDIEMNYYRVTDQYFIAVEYAEDRDLVIKTRNKRFYKRIIPMHEDWHYRYPNYNPIRMRSESVTDINYDDNWIVAKSITWRDSLKHFYIINRNDATVVGGYTDSLQYAAACDSLAVNAKLDGSRMKRVFKKMEKYR